MSEPTCPYPLDKCSHPSCGKPIFFAISQKTGKPMPVDPQPAANGNLRVLRQDDGPPVALTLTVAERFGKTGLYLTHFATCEYAESFRRKGRRTP